MIYKDSQPPLCTPIWAVAYRMNDDTKRTKLSCEPTLGEVRRGVGKQSLFRTEREQKPSEKAEESVSNQENTLIHTKKRLNFTIHLCKKRIDKLQEMIVEAENDFIR